MLNTLSDKSHALQYFARHVTIATELALEPLKLDNKYVGQVLQPIELDRENRGAFLALDAEIVRLLVRDLVLLQ